MLFSGYVIRTYTHFDVLCHNELEKYNIDIDKNPRRLLAKMMKNTDFTKLRAFEIC